MNIQKTFGSFTVKLGLLGALTLGGCFANTLPYMRAETAQRLAAPAWMIKRDIPSAPYTLRAYERIHDKGGLANVYIEGDGEEHTSPTEWVNNPTPINPVALHLATKDKAENVIYLGRPCQYVEQECDRSTWMEARYADDVIGSYEEALDEIAARYNIRGFNLIGYSGGGAIATLLAAQRRDVISLRTVAGVMDHQTQSTHLAQGALTQSLNPVAEASRLVDVPQYHFVGGQDPFVPPAVLHSYLQEMPPTNCVQTMLIQEAGYDTGWVNKWPELVALPVHCYGEKKAMRSVMVGQPVSDAPTSTVESANGADQQPVTRLRGLKPVKP